MASSINEQEDNFLRFFKLVTGPGTEAVRIFFDSFFPNNTLDIVLRREENNIRRSKSNWRLTQKQLDLLFLAIGIATSKEFDITLMIGLIRNFIPTIGHRIMPKNTNWNCLPNPKDIAKGNDLIRIKFHRNEIAHSGLDTLDTNTFKANWKNVKEAISRLSGTCLDQRCIELETMRLDNISEVRKEFKRLKADMIEYVNELRIPGRDAQSLKIEEWENENHKFVKTNAVDTIINALQIENCVTVIGSFGQGKSALIQHISLRLRDEEGYTIIPCRYPFEIETWYEKEKNQIFMVDDLYGKSCLMPTKLEYWQDYAKFLEMILKQGMANIIVSSRPHIFTDANSKCSNDVFQYVIDLKNNPLTDMQKKELLKLYIPYLEPSAIDSLLNNNDEDIVHHFPLLCVKSARLSTILKRQLGVHHFFGNRKLVHREFLDSLRKTDPCLYKAILIFVLLGGKISQQEYSKEDRFQRQEGILKTLMVDLDIAKETFYICIENLSGTYLKKNRDMFLSINNETFDILLEYCARVSQERIINHLDSSPLLTRSYFKSIVLCVSNAVICVRPENENYFFQRMLDSIYDKKVFLVFDQALMNKKEYRRKFILFIRNKGLENNQLVSRILNTRDEAQVEGTLPMLPIQIASHRGWNDIVELLVAYVDVNFYGIVGFSALHAACVVGHVSTVKVLIDNNANVNKTANWGQVVSALYRTPKIPVFSETHTFLSETAEISPLFIACLFNHTSIVELLIHNGACLSIENNQLEIQNCPPLFKPFLTTLAPGALLLSLAMRHKNKKMIEILLNYGAKYCKEIPDETSFDIPLG